METRLSQEAKMLSQLQKEISRDLLAVSDEIIQDYHLAPSILKPSFREFMVNISEPVLFRDYYKRDDEQRVVEYPTFFIKIEDCKHIKNRIISGNGDFVTLSETNIINNLKDIPKKHGFMGFKFVEVPIGIVPLKKNSFFIVDDTESLEKALEMLANDEIEKANSGFIKIFDFCNYSFLSPRCRKIFKEKLEILLSDEEISKLLKLFQSEKELKELGNLQMTIINTVLSIDKKVFQIWNNIDFQGTPPKIVIEQLALENRNKYIEFQKAIATMFLKLLGFDVIILSSNKDSAFLENFVEDELYTTFNETALYNEGQVEKPGLFSKWFKK